MSGFGSKLSGLAKGAALAAGTAGIGALAVTLKTGYDEWTNQVEVAAKTRAALKATGGVANVTAKQIQSLATQIEHKTGIDDEAIKTNENLLLAFKNVRNEAGAGNDVFARATKAISDMSVATGKSSDALTFKLGKALNDPTAGLGRLAQAGVSFTEAQKKNIKSLQEHGHLLEAQNIILGEVEGRYKGAAEAVGKTLPGQLAIAHQAFNDFAGDLVARMVPAAQQAIGWLRDHWPQISAALEGMWATVKPVLQAFGSAVGSVATAIRDNWSTIGPIVKHVEDTLKAMFQNMAAWIRIFSDVLHGDWGAAWGEFKGIVGRSLKAAGALLGDAVGLLGKAATALGKAILAGIKAGVSALAGLLHEKLSELGGIISGWAGSAYAYAFKIGSNIVHGILDGIGDLAGKVGHKIASGVKGAVSFAGGLLHGSGPFMFTIHEIGKPLAEGVIAGWIAGSAELPAKMAESLRNAIEKARQVVDAKRGAFTAAFSSLSEEALSAFDAKTQAFKTPAEKLLDKLVSQHDAAEFKARLADARGAYSDALAAFAAFEQDPTQGGTLDAAQQASKQKELGGAVLAAQKGVDDLLYQQHVDALQKKAGAERKQQDATDAVHRQNLAQQIAAIGDELSQKGAPAATATEKIIKLLSGYGVNFAQVGRDMGIAWIGAFKSALEEAAGQSGDLAGAIGKVAAGITIPKAAKKLAEGGIVTRPTLAMVGEAGPEAVIPLSHGGGGMVVNVTVQGALLGTSVQQVAETIRTELIRINRRTGGRALA